ncbi:SDR family NAD(P)-dependent oxidoreductase [Glycomyces arizonensis]|uniref:SDR family NAD(P)-dependent oxidoreductase n=1 Tax=Glycomyces arizonensis TaxID=256035 RepID=UPI0003FA0A05|nr:SDR family NAD(P)-dependent oxidoreductase [Glycomyces arizonensis]
MNTTPAVLLTGANGGIGTPAALRLAEAGRIVYAGMRGTDRHGAFDGVERIRPLPLDVTDPASVAEALGRIAAERGEAGLQAVVNNAGVIVQGPLELVPDAELHRQFDVNVFGPVRVIRAALPLLRAGRGRIVNVGAPTAYVPVPFHAPIAASKAALHAMTTALRTELAAWDLPVTAVVPGLVDTPLFKKAAEARRAVAIDPDRAALYREQLAAVKRAESGQRAAPPDRAAEAIVEAVTARRVKARYFGGSDARTMVTLVAKLPAGLRERLIARVLGVRGVKAPTTVAPAS